MKYETTARRQIVASFNRDRAVNYLTRIVSRADAEEAVDEALAISLERMPVGEQDNPTAWIMTVAYHEALRFCESQYKLGRTDAHDPDSLTFAYLAEAEARSPHALAEVNEALGMLGELRDAERVALLDLASGFSYREIKERHGWTLTKVNRCLVEGRARLRECLEAV